MTASNEVDRLIDDLEKRLNRARTNLAMRTPGRKAFIADIMKQVRDIAIAASPQAPVVPTAATEPSPTTPTRDPSRVMTFTPPARLILGPGGSTQMSPSDSMRADEELGRSPFVKRGGGNGQ